MARSKARSLQAEPAYVGPDGKRSDRAIWNDIIGDDVMPWDTTAEEQDIMHARSRPIEPVDKTRQRP